jgi:hypothetical protein
VGSTAASMDAGPGGAGALPGHGVEATPGSGGGGCAMPLAPWTPIGSTPAQRGMGWSDG